MNIRINIAEGYKRALERMDSQLSRWMEVAPDMQLLADAVLEHIEAVVVPAMTQHAEPEMVLLADGQEQEVAAWRCLDEFCSLQGWSELDRRVAQMDNGSSATSMRLFHGDTSRRWCVTVRVIES